MPQAVKEQWINGKDIIFDVTSGRHVTVIDALNEGVLDGKNLDYKVSIARTSVSVVDGLELEIRTGLPDGIFSKQKSQFGPIWEGLT
jgi:hypothetical protein